MASANELTGHGLQKVAEDQPYRYVEYPKMVYPSGEVSPDPADYVIVNNFIEEKMAMGQEITPGELSHLNKQQLLDAVHPEGMTMDNTRDEIVDAVNQIIGTLNDPTSTD